VGSETAPWSSRSTSTRLHPVTRRMSTAPRGRSGRKLASDGSRADGTGPAWDVGVDRRENGIEHLWIERP
jgi:hypothetical protein